jgi:maltooligosyltrehalose trehalohydrolase
MSARREARRFAPDRIRAPEAGVYPWELPLGAWPRPDGLTEFRVWAPGAGTIALRLAGGEAGSDGSRDLELEHVGHGIHETVAEAPPGSDYWLLVNGIELPDPSSRWQPAGLRGPSRVLDASTLPGAGPSFDPPSAEELVLYEMHVGTFTPQGTFEAAIPHLRELAEIGITAIEIMPVAEFPGHHGWGYDGVYISAAHSTYGGPHGLARLVQAAHEGGIAVILDVVYNHLGASGVTAMTAFGPYFTGKYETPWGKAINFDDADSDPVREWVIQSAIGWVRDFGIDGLRLDAIHAIFDSGAEHIVAAIARRVHELNERALVIAESGLNDPRVMRHPERGGYGCDAAWADDFHHALRVLLTGTRDGYYSEFGSVAQLAKAYHRPYVHDGGYSTFRRRRFGAPADDVAPTGFVVFSQNHDQVGNRAFGDRLPAHVRPLAAFSTLLAPFVPLLFQGEEYGEPAPFQFFSDHIDEKIAAATREGRRREFAAFEQFGREIPDPQSPKTFESSKLTRERDAKLARLYPELLAARRNLPGGDAHEIEFDEPGRWLRVRRGPFEIVSNFAGEPRRVACAGGRLVLATDEESCIKDGYVAMAPLSGALIE